MSARTRLDGAGLLDMLQNGREATAAEVPVPVPARDELVKLIAWQQGWADKLRRTDPERAQGWQEAADMSREQLAREYPEAGK